MPRIRLQLLGFTDLRDPEGGEIRSILAQPKRLALLAYLACTPGSSFRRRDKLLGLFWPELDQERARAALRQSIYFLKRSLAPNEVLERRGEGELGVSRGNLWCDVVAFVEAVETGDWEAALELYQGDLLEGFFLTESPEFEHWLDDERERLRELACRAGWARAHDLIEADHSAEAERVAQRVLNLAAADETEVRRFMAALAARGDRAAALRFYGRFAALLAEDLGVIPSPETRGVADRLRSPPNPQGETDAGGSPDPLHDEESDVAGGALPPGVTSTAPAPPTPTRAGGRRRRLRKAIVGVLAVVVPGALVGLGVLLGRHVPDEGGSASRAARRMVVAPFENRTGDPTLDGWGLNLMAFASRGIERAHVVDVVAPSRVLGLLDGVGGTGSPSAIDIAPTTGAGFLVSGSYSVSGDQVRIDVEISDASAGALLRALPRITGPADSLEVMLTRVADRISAAVAVLLDPDPIGWAVRSSMPPSLEAYRGFASAYDLFCRGEWDAALERAQEVLPECAGYHPLLALVRMVLRRQGRFAAADTVHARIASLRPRLNRMELTYEDWIEAGWRGDRMWSTQAAEELYRMDSVYFGFSAGSTAYRAGRLGAAVTRLLNAAAEARCGRHWLARVALPAEVFHLLGRYEEELSTARRGLSEFPDHPALLGAEVRAMVGLGRLHAVDSLVAFMADLLARPGLPLGRQLSQAARELRVHGYADAHEALAAQALAWYGSRPPTEMRFDRGRAFVDAERWTDADTVFAGLAAAEACPVACLGSRGVTLAHLGRTAEAREILRELEQVEIAGGGDADGLAPHGPAPGGWGQARRWQAAITAALGDLDEAVLLLQQGFGQGLGFGIWFHQDPEWDPLRSYPPFQALIRPRE
jgi:DNA-binding SARP family transcriptional activator/tetratricopeptide (TPR) repeat protein/TolB-like protein